MSTQFTKVRAAVAGTLLLVAALTACKSESPAALLEEAKRYEQKGDNKAAVIQLKNALNISPDNVEARAALARVSLEIGDPLAAEKEARRALALNGPAEQIAPVLARALAYQGKYQDALNALDKLAPSADVLALRGSTLVGLGKGEEAEQAFNAALAKEPGHGDALVGLARWKASQQDWTTAERLVQAALKAHPEHVGAWQLKGDLLRVQNKSAEALAAYQQILKIKPDHRTAHLEQAALNIAAGKYETAQADINAARKTTPGSFLVAYQQALLDYSRGKLKDAQTNLLKVLQVAPEDKQSQLLAGTVALKLGQLGQAEDHLRKYVEWNPASLYARKMLVSTLLKAGRGRDAQTVLAPALKDGKDPAVLHLAGEAAIVTKELGKAATYLTEAIRLAPEAAPPYRTLGMVKLAQGDRAGGLAALQKAVALDPASLEAGESLIGALADAGQYDKALAAVTALEKAQPDNAAVQVMKGNIHVERKDHVRARAAFEQALVVEPAHLPAIAGLARLDQQEKKAAQARQRYEALLAKQPDNAAAMTALARLEIGLGRRKEGVAWLEKATVADANDVDAALLLGQQYLALDMPQKAQTLLRRYRVSHPDNVGVLDALGQAQLANKDGAAALESFNRMASAAPGAAMPQIRLAVAQLMMKNPTAATASLNKAVILEPDNIQAYIAKAELVASEKDFAGATAILRQVQKQFPNSPVGHTLEGDLLLQQGNPKAALVPYERSLAIDNSAAGTIKLAKAMHDAGLAKEADQRVGAYLKKHPGDPITTLYFADGHMAAKRYPEAVTLLEGLARSTPDNAVVLNNLAWAYQQMHDPRALPTAEQALAINGENPDALDTLGWLLVEQGKYERAISLLRKAASAAPKQPQVRYHLGVGLYKSGDKAGARKVLQEALAQGSGFSEAEQVKALLKQL